MKINLSINQQQKEDVKTKRGDSASVGVTRTDWNGFMEANEENINTNI